MRDFFAALDGSGTMAFNRPLAGGACYATIGQRSTVDMVEVGGNLLSVGNVVAVPANAELKAVRPYKNHWPQLHLQLWDAGEVPVPGPRAPWRLETSWTYANGADSTWRLRAVIPFAGRRHCQLTFSHPPPLNSTVATYDYAVEAIKRRIQPYAEAVATLDGSTLLNPTAARLVMPTENESHIIYLGGWDSEEAVEEFLVYTRKPLAGTVTDAVFIAEVWGDRGAGF